MGSLSRIQKAVKQMMEKNKWEWFVSLNPDRPLSAPDIETKLKEWRLQLIKKEKIQIAYMGIINTIPMPHVHLLATGHNRHGKTLSDIDIKYHESTWKGSAKIVPVYSKEKIIDYLVEQNMPDGKHELLIPFNQKLLKRYVA